MINNVYYTIQKVTESFSFKKPLPNNIIEYIKNKHSQNLSSSLFAWNLLNEYFNADLSKVNFLKSGKPTLDGVSFSISHSNGYVAIAFCYYPISLGIDIEKIDNRNLDFLTRFSSDLKISDNKTKYKFWTEHEATVKALNLNLLNDTSNLFKGFSNTVQTVDGEFLVSIYNESNLPIKEIRFDN